MLGVVLLVIQVILFLKEGFSMKSKKHNSDKFMGSVKVGAKGQIVIPKEVRAMFDIEPGDTLMLLADTEKGIAIQKYGIFAKLADAIFSGKAKEVLPDENEDDAMIFAKNIKEIGDDDNARN